MVEETSDDGSSFDKPVTVSLYDTKASKNYVTDQTSGNADLVFVWYGNR